MIALLADRRCQYDPRAEWIELPRTDDQSHEATSGLTSSRLGRTESGLRSHQLFGLKLSGMGTSHRQDIDSNSAGWALL